MITLIWILSILSLIGFWTFALVYEERVKEHKEKSNAGYYSNLSFGQYCEAAEKYYNKGKYLVLAFSCGAVFGLCVVYLIEHYIGFCGL